MHFGGILSLLIREMVFAKCEKHNNSIFLPMKIRFLQTSAAYKFLNFVNIPTVLLQDCLADYLKKKY